MARKILLDQLTGRARSRQELSDKLAAKLVPDDVATRLLDRFEEVGLVDDEAFARPGWTSRGAGGGRSLARRALAQELRRKGIDDEVAREVLDEIDPADEEEAARALVRKKLRTLTRVDDTVATRRLVAMLARKGYGSGLAFAVVRDELLPRRAPATGRLRPRCGHNAPVADEREILTYELFGVAVRDLAQQVVDDGFEPDLVLSIARGGLGLGMGLGYALDVKNLSAINVEFYTGIDQRLDVPIMLPPTPDAVDLAGLKVLIADDVADTGKTLEIVRDFCADHVAEARMAVIYEKPWTVIHPDFVWRRTEAWIDFPWSAAPPLVQRTRPDA